MPNRKEWEEAQPPIPDPLLIMKGVLKEFDDNCGHNKPAAILNMALLQEIILNHLFKDGYICGITYTQGCKVIANWVKLKFEQINFLTKD